MFLIICIAYMAIVILIARYQAGFYNAHMSDGKTLNHPLWFALYCIAPIVVFLIWKDWWEVLAGFLIRGVVFSPLLNLLRKPRKTFFYIHGVEGEGSSWLDEQLMKVNKLYPYIWFAEVIVLGLLLYFRI